MLEKSWGLADGAYAKKDFLKPAMSLGMTVGRRPALRFLGSSALLVIQVNSPRTHVIDMIRLPTT